MNERTLSLSVSVTCACAWTAWAAMTGLLCVALLTDNLIWASFGLALSAIAATLHMRCFLIEHDQHMQASHALSQEMGRVTRLRSGP